MNLERFDPDCRLYKTLFMTTDSYKNNEDSSYVIFAILCENNFN